MDTSTINQIISTAGVMVVGFAALLFYWKGLKAKQNIQREISLLKDCYFYRELINKYKSEKGIRNNYNKYRKDVQKKIDYTPSQFSEPAEIRKRLEVLNTKDTEIQAFLNKISV